MFSSCGSLLDHLPGKMPFDKAGIDLSYDLAYFFNLKNPEDQVATVFLLQNIFSAHISDRKGYSSFEFTRETFV